MKLGLAIAAFAFSRELRDVAGAVSFDFVARHYFPAGYQDGTTSGVPDLFGYGFGALERSYYDASQKVFYGGSELGFVTISDFNSFPDVSVLDINIPLADALTDIKVCGDHLFVTTKDDPSPGLLHVFTTAKKNGDGFKGPTLIQSLEVGVGPDHILVSKDCQIVATANEGEGDYSDEVGLINPVGSVSILRGPFDDAANPPSNTLVSLDKWTEEELLEKGVHLPLSLNALFYWSNSEDISVNFDNAIANYSPDMNLEPEYMAWADGEDKIYVNLQENSAVVVIDVASNEATDIHAYGLKTGIPVDVVEDDGCEAMPIVDGLHFLRSPDSITTFQLDGATYLVTANEGDDVEYGEFEELVKAKNLFDGSSLTFANMTVDPLIFDPTDITSGQSRYFNSECDESSAATPWCSGSMRFNIGSSMVDYSDPNSPHIYRLVGIGGRGISIFKVTVDGLDLVWDSEDEFEVEGCAAFPWAHNGVHDEEFAPIGGALYNSLGPNDGLLEAIMELNDPNEDGCDDGGDGNPGACPLSQTIDERSLKDGYAAETVVAGEACGKVFIVTVSEKNSVGFLYDVSDPTSPALAQVFHLSPISKTLNPGLAYDARKLGEIDAESIQFLEESKSPTGKAAVIFSGAWSGTTSFWEFTCPGDKEPDEGDDTGSSAVTLSATLSLCMTLITALVAFTM